MWYGITLNISLVARLPFAVFSPANMSKEKKNVSYFLYASSGEQNTHSNMYIERKESKKCVE